MHTCSIKQGRIYPPQNFEPAEVEAAEAEGQIGAIHECQLQQRREEGNKVQNVPHRAQHACLALSLLRLHRIDSLVYIASCVGHVHSIT